MVMGGFGPTGKLGRFRLTSLQTELISRSRRPRRSDGRLFTVTAFEEAETRTCDEERTGLRRDGGDRTLHENEPD